MANLAKSATPDAASSQPEPQHAASQPSPLAPPSALAQSQQPHVAVSPSAYATARPSAETLRQSSPAGSTPFRPQLSSLQALPSATSSEVQHQVSAAQMPSPAWQGGSVSPAAAAASGPLQYQASAPAPSVQISPSAPAAYAGPYSYSQPLSSAQTIVPPQSLGIPQYSYPPSSAPQGTALPRGSPAGGAPLAYQGGTGAPPPTGAPLHSLSSALVYAARGNAGWPPGSAPPYRVQQQPGIRGHMPQMSSQAYIQQASAQLQQSFPAYQAYPMPQGPPGASYGRPKPAAGLPPKPAEGAAPRPAPGGAPTSSASPVNGPAQAPYPTYQHPTWHMGPVRRVPISGPTASIPHIKRPGAPKVEGLGPASTSRIPGVFTVSDRKVRVPPGEEETTPMYVLLRRWVQNDPLLVPVPLPGSKSDPQNSEPLEKPTATAMEVDMELPIMDTSETNRTRFSPEELLEANKEHWVKVRQYHMAQRIARLESFRQHLASLIPDPNLRSSSPPIEDSPRKDSDPASEDREDLPSTVGEEAARSFGEQLATATVQPSFSQLPAALTNPSNAPQSAQQPGTGDTPIMLSD